MTQDASLRESSSKRSDLLLNASYKSDTVTTRRDNEEKVLEQNKVFHKPGIASASVRAGSILYVIIKCWLCKTSGSLR